MCVRAPCLPRPLRYLPSATWQLELFLALFTSALLFLQLLRPSSRLSGVHFIPHLTVPLSLVLLLDSYLTLAALESQYHSASRSTSASASSSHSVLIDGYSLSARRFREQRDCYLALYTVVVSAALRLTEGLTAEVRRLKGDNYRLQTRLDRLEPPSHAPTHSARSTA